MTKFKTNLIKIVIFFSVFILFPIFTSKKALALEKIILFISDSKGKPHIVPDYDKKIELLKNHFSHPPSDPVSLIFSGNPPIQIRVTSFIGNGENSMILLTHASNALRIPLSSHKVDQLDRYLDAWKKLRQGLQENKFLIEILAKQEHEFILAEKVNIITDYNHFIQEYKNCREPKIDIHNKITCNYCKLLEMHEKFLELVYFIAEFYEIGDLNNGSNIAYVQDERGQKKWMILDFSPDVVKFKEKFQTQQKQKQWADIFNILKGLYDQNNFMIAGPTGKRFDGRNKLLVLDHAIQELAKDTRLGELDGCIEVGKDSLLNQYDHELYQTLKNLCKSS